MTRHGSHHDPHWVHRSALHAVAAWILVASFAFSFNAVWTFAKARKRAEKEVRIVRESRVQWIRHEGRIYTQDQTVDLLRRRPWWTALPFAGLAVLMGACAIFAFWRPVLSASAALGIALAGGVAQLLRTPRLDVSSVGFFVFLWILLALGIRSSVGFARVQRERAKPDATSDSAAAA